MRLSFSEDHRDLKEALSAVLIREATSDRARKAVVSPMGWDEPLWRQLGELGWYAITLDEDLGGMAQSPLSLCLVAEEVGGRIAALPFASSVLGFSEMVRSAPDQTVLSDLYPKLADGSAIGAVILPDTWSNAMVNATSLSGEASYVMDRGSCTHAITLVEDNGEPCLSVLECGSAIERPHAEALDILNPGGPATFVSAEMRVLARGEEASSIWQDMLSRYATLLAFFQIGGAEAALRAACEHVRDRYAFGRPLGSFQSIKHGLADIYGAIAIARSNAWYAAANLAASGPNLLAAASAARVSATDAYRRAATANVHYHGALGATQECDAHLHYRRAQSLGSVLGPPDRWRDIFIEAHTRLTNA